MTATTLRTRRAFAPRPIAFHGILTPAGWQLKHYSVRHAASVPDAGTPEWSAFTDGRAEAYRALPAPARTAARPGVGFLVEHRGSTADYVVLGWWDNENELPVRAFVRESASDAPWRPAGRSESFCVWDLQIMAFERDTYVRSFLAPMPDDAARKRYLGSWLVPPPDPVHSLDAERVE